MRAIIKFTKEENIRFISHLDILRMFQRAVKRAGLPVSYSLGFNPHMLIGFACALPTGAMSLAEYAEIRLDTDIPTYEILQRLNNVLPNGCRVLDISTLPAEYPSLMAVVEAAEYKIDIMQRGADSLIKELVDEVMSSKEFVISKKTKKGFKPTDIRPIIKEMSFSEGAIYCRLSAGNNANLRPDSLMRYFSDQFDCFPDYVITRTALFITENGLVIDAMSAAGGNL